VRYLVTKDLNNNDVDVVEVVAVDLVKESANKDQAKSLLVVQSNELVEAFYDTDLSATEHKLLRYSATKLKSHPYDFPNVSFSISEFLQACGIKGHAYHSKVDKLADGLSQKRMKIKIGKRTDYIPWFQRVSYDDGYVYIVFNTLIEPLLLQLEGTFTQYNYRYIGDMQSGYTIRLFELLKQYAPIGHRKIELETLKKMLGVPDKYKQYGQFKLRVLGQAKKELDAKGGLTFDYEEVKKGRKVVELIFYIKTTKPKNSKRLPELTTESSFVTEAKYLLENYPFDISETKLKTWSKYGIELLSAVFEEVKERKMEHPAAYIEKVLKTKYERNQSLKEGLIADSEFAKEQIATFIDDITGSRYKEMLPDFMIQRQFNFHMSLQFGPDEIEDLWNMNSEYIISSYKNSVKNP